MCQRQGVVVSLQQTVRNLIPACALPLAHLGSSLLGGRRRTGPAQWHPVQTRPETWPSRLQWGWACSQRSVCHLPKILYHTLTFYNKQPLGKSAQISINTVINIDFTNRPSGWNPKSFPEFIMKQQHKTRQEHFNEIGFKKVFVSLSCWIK